MSRLTIAILFGGCSEEHDVSVKSATEIAASIDPQKYEPIYVGITQSGVWKLCELPSAEWEEGRLPSSRDLAGQRDSRAARRRGGQRRTVHIDAVFPVLHGKTGEDGAVQGLLELSGIPYVGCGIQSSTTCMDKSLAYTVARSAGIDTPEFWVLNGADMAAPDALAYPVFVRPAPSGTSFGVTKVAGAGEVDAALMAAGRYDSKVLIEQAVLGTEVGCAVLGNGSELIVGAVDQIELLRGIFRIHQEAEPAKGSENAVITVPADLPDAKGDEIREAAMSIYVALGCEGLARVDMFLQEDGRVVLNEVNTLPGFTAYSRLPRMMAAAGMSLSEVIDRCISLAMAR
jgi:D-alanine--(R)-lactate ligase